MSETFGPGYFGHVPVDHHQSNYSRVGGYNPQVAGAEGWAKAIHEYVQKHIEIPFGPQARILEVGCADGATVALLRQMGYDAWGCDVSKYILGRAEAWVQPYLHHVDIRNKEAFMALYAPVPAYDLLVSKDVLEHLTEDEIRLALATFWRISQQQLHVVNTGEFPYQAFDGDETHVTRWPLNRWHQEGWRLGIQATFLRT